MALLIPVTNDASQRLQITLNGQSVILELKWIPRQEVWALTVRNSDESIIVQNRFLDTNYSVFNGVYKRGFVGEIAAQSLTSSPQEIGRDPWGATHRLIYVN